MTEPLWTPSAERLKSARLGRFMDEVRAAWGVDATDYGALHAWSIAEPAQFWRSMWDFAGIIGDGPGERIVIDGERMPGARWFLDARLNYAENLLRRRDEADALVFWGEERVRRRLSFAEMHDQVSRMAQALAARGVRQGDRVAGYLPNMPETIVSALAAASLGAVWSSCSSDFGTRGVLDRFGQIAPKVLIAADGYFYGGKTFDRRLQVREILAELPTVEHVIVVPYAEESPALDAIANAALYGAALDEQPGGPIDFARMPFDHPLVIMFSSGTTGAPKCIVHGTGGTLLQHMKEHALQSDIGRGDRVFYATTCGWMMWNWLVSALASEATLLLYDGSPFHPDGNVLFDYADAEAMTLFGTSAKYLDAAAKAGLEPKRTHDLGTLRTMTSTGSPLAPEGFEYVYRAIKDDLHLASISGGTDIISCFALGNPMGPVRRGELQAFGLGMAVGRVRRRRQARARRAGRARVHAALPLHAGLVLERPGRRQVPQRLFRPLRRRLVPRRLGDAHRARRPGHPRPLGRGAEPRRRAHRHGGDLPPGGAVRRGAGGHLHRPGLGGRPAHRALRPPARGASRWTTRSPTGSRRASAASARPATCRRR